MSEIVNEAWRKYRVQLQSHPPRTKLYRFGYAGPFGHFLHKLMEKIFKDKKDSKTFATKVLLEQLTSSPWNNLFFMLYYGLVVEGRSWSLVTTKVRKDYPSVQLTAWKFWPINCWLGELPVYASAVSSSVPQLHWFMLDHLSQSEG